MNRIVLVIGIIFLLVGITINPAVAVLNPNEDTTPPVTWHELNPPEPDGKNGWYSHVDVWICAEDLESGVKAIMVSLYGGTWQTFQGYPCATFLFTHEGSIPIDYTAVDNAGNQAPIKSFIIKVDRTGPTIDITYEVVGGNQWIGWDLVFTVIATDPYSGMDRVEFFLNDGLQDIVYGSGPEYQWGFRYYGDMSIDVRADAYDNVGHMASDVADGKDKTISNVLLANKIEKVEDCDCQSVSDDDIDRIEKAINRIESYTKLLSLYSKRNTEYEELSEEINSRISSFKGRIQEIKDLLSYQPDCILFFIGFITLWPLANLLYSIMNSYPDTLLYDILNPFMQLFAILSYIFWDQALWLNCLWTKIFNPYPENSLINPINNIINIPN
jgi:hypothetical protein